MSRRQVLNDNKVVSASNLYDDLKPPYIINVYSLFFIIVFVSSSILCRVRVNYPNMKFTSIEFSIHEPCQLYDPEMQKYIQIK